MSQIYIIAHDIRSSHNVGALFRTAEGLGIDKILISGYTPYPVLQDDQRLPHIARKVNDRIAKTALGAEKMVSWEYSEDIISTINQLKLSGFVIIALEQANDSITLPDVNKHLSIKPDSKVAIILGREVEGVDRALVELADCTVEIPMYGKKESYNVVEAATMAMYQLRFGK